MAAQRIVLTSPWKLGLFVFLLVVGCGFGLVYAHLEFFGGTLDFQDEKQLRIFYGVCGGVALLGLLGYMSVVTAARPLDRVVRGGKRREKLLKKIADTDDPRDVDSDDFSDDPQLQRIVERWVEDSSAAMSAQMAIRNQREALSSLAAQVQTASASQTQLSAEGTDDDLAPLVDAINNYVQGVRSATPEPQPTAAPTSTSAELQAQWNAASAEFAQHEQQLLGFASSIAASSEEINRRSTMSRGSGTGDLEPICRRNATRMGELRQKLEELAEESNRHAINAALQVSRLGDSGQELLAVTEEIRALSTRYQRLVADLRLCENDQETVLAELDKANASEGGSAGLSPESMEKLSMVLDQNSGGIQEIASGLRRAVSQLAQAIDPSSDPFPATSGPISVPSPVLQAGGEDSGPERVYDLAEFGAQPVAAEAPDQEPVYDLADFGAVQL